MRLEFTPIGSSVGAEVKGVTLDGKLTQENVRELRDAVLQYGVLVFRDQEIDDATQVAISQCFGPLEIFVSKAHINAQHPEIMEIADVGDTTKWLSVAQYWHTDGSYKAVPAYVTTLRALEIPPSGGETWFANTCAAYEALPEERKREIDDVFVVHDLAHSRHMVPNMPPFSPEERAAVPPVVHPLARVHSGNGKKVIYVGCHAREVVGRERAEGRSLLNELEEFATQDRFVYRHRWRPGDLVIWDNRTTMHRATPYDASKHRRVMHRTEVSGAAA